jgi:molecular chaperone HtpG
MTEPTKQKIAFDVETSRILQILSSEIYDSPKAFLRENVQNAYDAILMRCAAEGISVAQRRIEVTVEPKFLMVRDDGIGMTVDVLKNNFWKAGSSGKKSELAQRAGVIGTFGIGAMANFGVCTSLRVETRYIGSAATLVSSAKRDDLRIAQDCIDLETFADEREPGTLVTAELDPAFTIDEAAVCDYLKQYVRFIPVPVLVNGHLISLEKFEDTLADRASGFQQISSHDVSRGAFAGALQVSLNGQSRVLARLTNILLSGTQIKGEAFFIQGGGPTHGFRNLFGLAPIPVSGQYGFGGFVNLDMLHPTAGREALSRESVQQIANLVEMIEAGVTTAIAETVAADDNQQFQQYLLAHGPIAGAHNVKISVLPAEAMVRLGDVKGYEPAKAKHFYAGQDGTIQKRFASDNANLFRVSQTNPRRQLQLRFLTEVAGLQQVPETTIVERIPGTQLSLDEAMFLVRLRSILLDDYLMSDVDVAFAEISHGVSFHVEKKGQILHISIARKIPPVAVVLECYSTARDVFEGFMKDFVREHLYPHIRDHVPSSTKQGRDALYRRLKENKELWRLQERDYGAIESLLADYLAGKAEFSDVLRTSAARSSVQRQEVSREQVGSVESELPGIIGGTDTSLPRNEFEPAPPILRDDLETDMKVLTVTAQHQKLNNFQMFLGLSDRLMRSEGELLRWPHTTKIIWGAHRIIYIFTDATGGLSLYYDIELRAPLQWAQTGGSMIPTTTIVTKNRAYVPVPNGLEPAFKITEGAKEFYVRFDTIP